MRRFLGFIALVAIVIGVLKLLSWWHGPAKRSVRLSPRTVFEQKQPLESPRRRTPKIPEAVKETRMEQTVGEKQATEEVESAPEDTATSALDEGVSVEAPRPDESQSPKSGSVQESTREAGRPEELPPAPERAYKAPLGIESSFLSARQLREIPVSDALFMNMEMAQGAVDERTDTERNRQAQGYYGWGILEDYADPDRPVEVLGGVLVAKDRRTGDLYFLSMPFSAAAVRRISDPAASFGPLGIKAHASQKRRMLEEAVEDGFVSGPPEEYELWFLFPRQEALYIQNKVVRSYECAIKEMGLPPDEAEAFRKGARLRLEVIALRRPNGGLLGCLIPRYFFWQGRKVPFPETCLVRDSEWQKLKELL